MGTHTFSFHIAVFASNAIHTGAIDRTLVDVDLDPGRPSGERAIYKPVRSPPTTLPSSLLVQININKALPTNYTPFMHHRQMVATRDFATPDALATFLVSRALQHYRLFALDFSASDSIALGFRIVRLFSPDLLALSAPSFPEGAHPRYQAYGGFHTSAPHPYP